MTAAMISLILTIIGCGYHLGPGSDNIDKSVRTVFVDNFQNNTSEAHLETILRKAFTDQLIKTSRFRLAADRASADAVLKGAIKSFAVSPIAYRSTNIAAIERIVFTLDIYLEDQNTKKILWRDQNFTGSADYNVDADRLIVTQGARKNALATLSNDAAERALRFMMSGF
jgi:hypothetical protein